MLKFLKLACQIYTVGMVHHRSKDQIRDEQASERQDDQHVYDGQSHDVMLEV